MKVVIVPTEGVTSDDIKDDIEKFLQKHALPGVQVAAENFDPVLFNLDVTVRIRTDAFIADEVEKAVASALMDHFTLQNRKLGEHLYLSEVYKIVEGILGVENSICEIFEQTSEQNESQGKKALQVIKADNNSTVIYLETDPEKIPPPPPLTKASTLTVNAEEYLP